MEIGMTSITTFVIGCVTILVGSVVTVYHPATGDWYVGKVSLAMFDNPQGLKQQGENYFSGTSNSHLGYPSGPEIRNPGEYGAGRLLSHALETSNVDLSEEFSAMIITQRGFQANSRVVTVSDTLLEELVNLKR